MYIPTPILNYYSVSTLYTDDIMGTYKVRNEIETKRNEINENETKSVKWKRNETKTNESKTK